MQKIDFGKFDLLTEEGRHSALMEINGHAKIQFALMGLSEQSWVSVLDLHIDIAIRDTKQKGTVTYFASSVELSVPRRISVGKAQWVVSGPLCISASSTSMCDPAKEPHLALKHQNMAALLSNWDKATQLFDFYTSEYRRLKKLISETNNVAL